MRVPADNEGVKRAQLRTLLVRGESVRDAARIAGTSFSLALEVYGQVQADKLARRWPSLFECWRFK